jgi:tetratricopeptide (TPR) repeat protein
MATLNSNGKRPPARPGWIAGALTVALAACLVTAEPPESAEARAQHEFARAAARLASEPTNSVAGWEFARASFDLAEFATNATQRARIAERGIAAARSLLAREPDSAGGNYYLAMNLGQLARTKLLGALKVVAEMETLFLRVADLDAGYDHAGSHRCLGLLYRDAPGWPASIGNKRKARLHLERAVALHPDHPENRLVLLESQVKWGLEKEAREALREGAEVLRRARTRLTGERWGDEWADWDRRWRQLQEALGIAPLAAIRESQP